MKILAVAKDGHIATDSHRKELRQHDSRFPYGRADGGVDDVSRTEPTAVAVMHRLRDAQARVAPANLLRVDVRGENARDGCGFISLGGGGSSDVAAKQRAERLDRNPKARQMRAEMGLPASPALAPRNERN